MNCAVTKRSQMLASDIRHRQLSANVSDHSLKYTGGLSTTIECTHSALTSTSLTPADVNVHLNIVSKAHVTDAASHAADNNKARKRE